MSILARKFQLKVPLIQAPLGGGPGTPRLAAAVSEAGALGTLSGAYLSGADIEKEVRAVRALTAKAFGMNLFTPSPASTPDPGRLQRAIAATHNYREELGLSDPNAFGPPYFESFEKQMRVVLEAKPAMFSFTFGLLDAKWIAALRDADIFTAGTATTLSEAQALEASGVDAVIAQGTEAGGHRGLFTPETPEPNLGTLPLVRELKKSLRVPIIAAGGLMTGADIRRGLEAGADAASLGTAFLVCDEAGTAKPYREALLHAREKNETVLTRAFSGRMARGIPNRFHLEMSQKPEACLPWPEQNFFTRDIRKAYAQAGRSDFLSLWAGTGLKHLRPMPAAKLVELLLAEFQTA